MSKKVKSSAGRKPRPRLTIGIDCGSLSRRNEHGGTRTITKNLLTALARMDKRNHYLLYSFSPLPKSIVTQLNAHMKQVVLPKFGYKSIWLRAHLWMRRPDAFIAVSQASPKTNVPVLGFIYDLSFWRFKTKTKYSQRLIKNTQELVSLSRHIITTSYASKDEIMEKFPQLKQKQITVCYPGVDAMFTDKGSKYVDTVPYFLFVGDLKSTKNIPTLIKAWELFLKESTRRANLVIIGGSRRANIDLKQTITAPNLSKRIKIKGNVGDKDLVKYYRGAVALVSPALVEGFGLPIVEAMACGTPVIAGNNSAMPEVVGNGAVLVEARDPREIAAAMLDLFNNEKLRLKFSRKGKNRAQSFSNQKFAKRILDSIYKYCL